MRIAIIVTFALHPSFGYTLRFIFSHVSLIENISNRRNDLTYSPKISYDFVLLGVAPIIGVLLPIFHIDICDSSNEKFKFSLVKDVDKIWRDQLIEAGDECIKLRFDPLLDSPFRNETEIISKAR